MSDMSANNQLAIAAFQQGRAYFTQRRFAQARRAVADYRRLIQYQAFRHDDRRPVNGLTRCSVIIVTHAAGAGLLECLDSLLAQSHPAFEIILIDNGGNERLHSSLQHKPILHVYCPMNLLPSEARNIGAFFARGPVLVFVDDDGQVCEDYLHQAEQALRIPNIIGIRGRIQPRTADGASNPHYDLGAETVPAAFTLEGNMAIRRSVFRAAGGFDPLMFGHEGKELTERCQRFAPAFQILYWPALLLYHDFAQGARLQAKRERQQLGADYRAYLAERRSQISDRLTSEPRTGDHHVSQAGISVLLRAGNNEQAAKKFLEQFVKVNTYKPVEVFVLFNEPETKHLDLVREFAGRLSVIVLPAADRTFTSIIPKLRYDQALIVSTSADIKNDSLGLIIFELKKSGRQGISTDIYGINSAFIVNKNLLSKFNEPLCGLEERGGFNARDGSDVVRGEKERAASLCLDPEYIFLKENAIRSGRPPIKERVIAGVATIPSRLRSLPEFLERIKPQFDHIYVYLNGHDSVPDCVKHDNVSYAWSRAHGDLKAAGKFFFLKEHKSGYYFSLDDDILYPEDYVYRMVLASKKYFDNIPVTVHGSIFGNPLEWYFERTRVFGMLHELNTDKFVNLCGSGTLAFHKKAICLSFDDFWPNPMCDLQVSVRARESRLPIVAIKREKGWLSVIEQDENKNSGGDYWNTMLVDDGDRSAIARTYNWGVLEYKKIVRDFISRRYSFSLNDFDKLCFDIEFLESLHADDHVPKDWSSNNSYLFHTRKYQYLKKEIKMLKNKLENNDCPEIGKLFASKEDVLIAPPSKNIHELRETVSVLRFELNELNKRFSVS